MQLEGARDLRDFRAEKTAFSVAFFSVAYTYNNIWSLLGESKKALLRRKET